MSECQRLAHYKQSVGLLRDPRDGGGNILGTQNRRRRYLDTKGTGSGPNDVDLYRGGRVVAVEQDRQSTQTRNDLAQQLEPLAREIAAGPRQIGDQTTTDRVCRECEYNWDSRGRLFCNLSVLARICDDHVNLEPHELRGDVGRTVVTAFRPAHIDAYVAAFGPAKFAEPRHKGGEPHVGSRWRASAEETNGGEVRHLLRTRRDRPRRRAAQQRDELAPFHSISTPAALIGTAHFSI